MAQDQLCPSGLEMETKGTSWDISNGIWWQCWQLDPTQNPRHEQVQLIISWKPSPTSLCYLLSSAPLMGKLSLSLVGI